MEKYVSTHLRGRYCLFVEIVPVWLWNDIKHGRVHPHPCDFEPSDELIDRLDDCFSNEAPTLFIWKAKLPKKPMLNIIADIRLILKKRQITIEDKFTDYMEKHGAPIYFKTVL